MSIEKIEQSNAGNDLSIYNITYSIYSPPSYNANFLSTEG